MVSIKSILCPVDFSDFSRPAFARAAALAKEHGASSMALHVVPIQPPAFAAHLAAAEPPPLALAHAERERLLGELKELTA